MVAKKNMIVVKCYGRYKSQKNDAGKRVAKPFECEINLPADTAALEQIFVSNYTRCVGQQELSDGSSKNIYKSTRNTNYLGILRRKLLPRVLAQKYPDFALPHETHIDEVVLPEGFKLTGELALPIPMMSRAQLKEYCDANGVARSSLDPAAYIDIAELRTDVFDYTQDRENFEKNLDRKKKKRAAEKVFNELNALNDVTAPVVAKKEVL